MTAIERVIKIIDKAIDKQRRAISNRNEVNYYLLRKLRQIKKELLKEQVSE